MRKTTLDQLAECKWELEETKEELDILQTKWNTLTKWFKKNHRGKYDGGMNEVIKVMNKREKKLGINQKIN